MGGGCGIRREGGKGGGGGRGMSEEEEGRLGLMFDGGGCYKLKVDSLSRHLTRRL